MTNAPAGAAAKHLTLDELEAPRSRTRAAASSSTFGVDAMKFVNGTRRHDLSLRGINARVVRAGRVRTGDAVATIA